MKYVVWALVVLLVIAHHDFWFWNDDRLVFGMLPVGLAYHIGLSIAAALTWYLATQFCWPSDLEDTSSGETKGGS